MAVVSKIIDSNENIIDLKDDVSGYTTNAGTLTGITAGAGITSSTSGNIITLGCDLKSTASSSLAAASRGSTSSREYPIGLDANGDLSANIPWSNTTYSSGTNILISDNTINTINIGEVYDTLSHTSKSVANLTYVTINTCSFTNSLGYYLFICHATWSKNEYGYREIQLRVNGGTGSINRFTDSRVSALTGNSTDTLTQELICVVNVTSDYNPIALVAYQNSGATLTITTHEIHAIRLK